MAIIQEKKKKNSSLFPIILLETMKQMETYRKQQVFPSGTPSLPNVGSNSCKHTHGKAPTLCLSVSDCLARSQLFREKPAIFWVIFILCIPRTLSSALHTLTAISGCAIARVTGRNITHQQPTPRQPCQWHFSRTARASTPSTYTSQSCQPKMMYLQRDFRAL